MRSAPDLNSGSPTDVMRTLGSVPRSRVDSEPGSMVPRVESDEGDVAGELGVGEVVVAAIR